MSIINAEDIIKHGDVQKALKVKRKQAAEHLEETGSLPLWWELGVSLGGPQGPRRKFVSPEQFYSHGFAYFEHCAETETMPTQSGLIMWMGFATNSSWHSYARRNIAFREVHAQLQMLLSHVLEQQLFEPSGQAGKMFMLKNIPEGFAFDDPVTQPLRYPWKDKQQTEITGADGGPLVIARDMDPEEAYLKMLDGGVLEPEEPESVEKSRETDGE